MNSDKEKIKKGQKVWVSTRNGIEEDIVKSAGRKYITLESDIRIKYNTNTLEQINSYGCGRRIITDLDVYNKKCHYDELRSDISHFNWNVISNDDIDKITEIINKYKEK